MAQEKKKELWLNIGSYIESIDAMLTLLAEVGLPPEQSAYLDLIHRSVGGLKGTYNELKAIETASDPTHAPLPMQGARVLAVDDDAVQLVFARRILERAGCHVTCMSTADAALQEMLSKQFDLVLMDTHLPGECDGFTAATEIRAREEGKNVHLPVIAFTSYRMAGYKELCFRSGMDDYLAKPASAQDLRAMVGKWLSKRQ